MSNRSSSGSLKSGESAMAGVPRGMAAMGWEISTD